MTGSPGRPGRIKKDAPSSGASFFCVIRSGAESMPRHFPCFSGSQSVSVCFSLFQSVSVCFSLFQSVSVCFSLFQSVSVSVCVSVSAPAPAPAFSCVRIFVVSPVFSVPAVFLSLLFAVAPVFPESLVPPVSSVPSVPEIYLIITALTIRTPERRFSSSLSASRW